MLKIQSESPQESVLKQAKLKKIKVFVMTATILEAILATVSRSISYFNYSSDPEFELLTSIKILLRLINIIAIGLSLSVDFLMYTMFFRVFFYFKKQFILKNNSSRRGAYACS